MSGEVREGERIPRREPPPYEDAKGFAAAVARDGFVATAIKDSNQDGPVGMMILLCIIATITGFVIKMLGTFV